MYWLSTLGTLLLATALRGSPVKFNPDAVIPEVVENTTLSTELQPPRINDESVLKHGVVYLINLYAVTNFSNLEDGEERLTDDVISTMPGILAPIATILLIVEADHEERPVNLDKFAEDLKAEGFKIKKGVKNGETKVIKVDLSDEDDDGFVDVLYPVDTMANKIRKKRGHCKKCKASKMMPPKNTGGCGGGCNQPQPQPQPQQTSSVAVVPIIPVFLLPVLVNEGGGCHPQC